MRKQSLIEIGLSGNEADIYLALLEIGPSLVSKIVNKTGINRTNIYDRLKRLIKKGLVAYVIKSNRKYFYAAEPKRLIRYLDEKEDRVRQEREMINQILPELEKIRPEPEDEQIEVYEGKEGLKTILEDILRTKKDVLTYGSEGNFTRVLKFYFKHYLARLEKTGIKMKVVFNYNDNRKPFSKFAQVRYIPRAYQTPTEITIYSNKVAIFLLSEKPKAILITSEKISLAYRKYFDILWKSGKKK